MKKIFAIFLLAAAVVMIATAPAAAADRPKHGQDIEVAIEVRADKIYDYVLIGMHRDATDGLDNAYDTLTPGPGMSDQYILMVVPHPEWQALKADFRTDFRAMKGHDTWKVLITTSLSDGTPLTMSIDQEQSKIPDGYSVTVEDMATGALQDLEQGAYVFPVKASGLAQQFMISIARQAGSHKQRHDRD